MNSRKIPVATRPSWTEYSDRQSGGSAASPEAAIARNLIAKAEAQVAGYKGYFEFHRTRYDYLLRLCKQMVPRRDATVLDIGRGPFSVRLSSHYSNVFTLGLPIIDDEFGTLRIDGDSGLRGHVVFDLNDACRTESWPELPKADIVCFAETIEHLHAPPELVLLFLKTALKPSGVLICQTPNAAALPKRVRLPFGINPYERLRLTHEHPGHIREYTKRELYEIGRAVGLEVRLHEYADYFGVEGGRLKRAINLCSRVPCALYPPFRRGQTVVYARSEKR